MTSPRTLLRALPLALAAFTIAACGGEPPEYVESKGNDPKWCGTAISYITDTENRVNREFDKPLTDPATVTQIEALVGRAERAKNIDGLPDWASDYLDDVIKAGEGLVRSKGNVQVVEQLQIKKVFEQTRPTFDRIVSECPASSVGVNPFDSFVPVGEV